MKIKILNGFSINNKTYTVMLYDLNNNLIAEKESSSNEVIFDVPRGYYKLYIFYGSNYLGNLVIYYNNCDTFYFNISKNNYHKVIFNLSDYYYNGLKIEKGNLFLWRII